MARDGRSVTGSASLGVKSTLATQVRIAATGTCRAEARPRCSAAVSLRAPACSDWGNRQAGVAIATEQRIRRAEGCGQQHHAKRHKRILSESELEPRWRQVGSRPWRCSVLTGGIPECGHVACLQTCAGPTPAVANPRIRDRDQGNPVSY